MVLITSNYCESNEEQETFRDYWGYIYDITNKNDGWNTKKLELFNKHEKTMLKQIDEIPTLTQNPKGYEIFNIPNELYRRILQTRNDSHLVDEHCKIPNCINNCYKVKKVHAVPKKTGHRYTFCKFNRGGCSGRNFCAFSGAT